MSLYHDWIVDISPPIVLFFLIALGLWCSVTCFEWTVYKKIARCFSQNELFVKFFFLETSFFLFFRSQKNFSNSASIHCSSKKEGELERIPVTRHSIQNAVWDSALTDTPAPVQAHVTRVGTENCSNNIEGNPKRETWWKGRSKCWWLKTLRNVA